MPRKDVHPWPQCYSSCCCFYMHLWFTFWRMRISISHPAAVCCQGQFCRMEPARRDSMDAGGFTGRGEDAKPRVTESDANLRAWRVIPPPDVCLRLDSTQLFSQIRRLSESKQNKKSRSCLLFVSFGGVAADKASLSSHKKQSVFSVFQSLLSKDSKADGLWRLRQEGSWAEVAHLIFLYQNFQMHAHSTNCCAFWVSLLNFSQNINKLISNSPQGQLCQHERASRESKSGRSECYPEDLTQIPPSPPCNNKGMLRW